MTRLAPICLAALAACSCAPLQSGDGSRPAQSSSIDATPLVLDFQTGFERTPVELYVNGQQLLDAVLTTDDRVGLAHSLKWTPRQSGRVQIKIVVGHTTQYSYNIEPDRGVYVGFSKDLDSGQLEMEQSAHPFAYD